MVDVKIYLIGGASVETKGLHMSFFDAKRIYSKVLKGKRGSYISDATNNTTMIPKRNILAVEITESGESRA